MFYVFIKRVKNSGDGPVCCFYNPDAHYDLFSFRIFGHNTIADVLFFFNNSIADALNITID